MREAILGRLKRLWSLVGGELAELASELTLTQQLVLSGALVGVAAGAATFVFDRLIVLGMRVSVTPLQGLAGAPRVLGILLFPALGAGLGAWIIHNASPEARGHGHSEVVRAIQEAEGRIPGRVAWVKSVASALTIGFGGSAGREGPSIQIGGAVGSWLGRRLGVPVRDLKVLVAAGAAGGLAAAFGTPLAAVFFTMEVVLKDFASEAFPAVVITSVTAVATARFMLGSERFMVPLAYDWKGWTEFLLLSSMGLVVAPFGALYRRSLHAVEDWFDAETRLPYWAGPALGGLVVGVIGLAVPSVMGTGQASINLALRGEASGWQPGAAALVKIAATSSTLGSGGSGGAFMPALFIGAMAGSAWAGALHHLFHVALAKGAFALTGMACLVAAFYQAPVTAMVMALEISQDYDMLMPLMLASVLSYLVTRRRREAPMVAR